MERKGRGGEGKDKEGKAASLCEPSVANCFWPKAISGTSGLTISPLPQASRHQVHRSEDDIAALLGRVV